MAIPPHKPYLLLSKIRSSGQSMIETLVTLPIVLAIGAGLLQFSMIWETKFALNHAALMAARTGAVSNIDINRMQESLAKYLIPINAPDLSSNDTSAADAYKNAYNAIFDTIVPPNGITATTRIRIANPTANAFEAASPFALTDIPPNNGPAFRFIPNDHLTNRNPGIDPGSQLSIQDANVLRIQVVHGIELNVPFVGNFIIDQFTFFMCGFADCDLDTTISANDPRRFWTEVLNQGLYPIQSVATVHMQSSPQFTQANQNFFMTRDQVCALSTQPGNCD